jgi:hypothetical protein
VGRRQQARQVERDAGPQGGDAHAPRSGRSATRRSASPGGQPGLAASRSRRVAPGRHNGRRPQAVCRRPGRPSRSRSPRRVLAYQPTGEPGRAASSSSAPKRMPTSRSITGLGGTAADSHSSPHRTGRGPRPGERPVAARTGSPPRNHRLLTPIERSPVIGVGPRRGPGPAAPRWPGRAARPGRTHPGKGIAKAPELVIYVIADTRLRVTGSGRALPEAPGQSTSVPERSAVSRAGVHQVAATVGGNKRPTPRGGSGQGTGCPPTPSAPAKRKQRPGTGWKASA